MSKKKGTSNKRKFFLTSILISIFTISFILGTTLLGTFDRNKSSKIRDTFDFIISPFESLLKSKDLIDSEEVVLKIPILMYHYVEYVTDERDTIRKSLNTEPHILEKQIATLINDGYIFIWPSEIPEILDNKKLHNNKYVVITFDDGYKDFYTDVFPILKKYNVKATNYISYYFLDNPNYMSSDDVRETVSSNLVEVGSHTLTHVDLTSVSEKEALQELIDSKKYLEDKFGVQISSFAYPYGYYNQKSQELVEKAGYSNAVTTDEGNLVSQKNILELKRIRPGILYDLDLISFIN